VCKAFLFLDMKVSIAEAISKLDQAKGQLYLKMAEHGSMSVEIYRPIKTDPQTPHKQDELYIIISGTGVFFKNDQRTTFRAGDVLFIEAGIKHRFENFTDDFMTWVIFYGPEGGEK
jgi:mannose-6-phosphate isomerase-like protein (cupin superfamily)